MVFWTFFVILLVCFFIVFVFYRNLVEAAKTLNGYSRARYALSYEQYDAVVKNKPHIFARVNDAYHSLIEWVPTMAFFVGGSIGHSKTEQDLVWNHF